MSKWSYIESRERGDLIELKLLKSLPFIFGLIGCVVLVDWLAPPSRIIPIKTFSLFAAFSLFTIIGMIWGYIGVGGN